MTLQFATGRTLGIAAATFLMTASANAASIIARTPTISGNGWVALGILAAFIGAIYLMIAGALHVERRDARLGRSRMHEEHGWFGFARDDEDGPPDNNGN